MTLIKYTPIIILYPSSIILYPTSIILDFIVSYGLTCSCLRCWVIIYPVQKSQTITNLCHDRLQAWHSDTGFCQTMVQRYDVTIPWRVKISEIWRQILVLCIYELFSAFLIQCDMNLTSFHWPSFSGVHFGEIILK